MFQFSRRAALKWRIMSLNNQSSTHIVGLLLSNSRTADQLCHCHLQFSDLPRQLSSCRISTSHFSTSLHSRSADEKSAKVPPSEGQEITGTDKSDIETILKTVDDVPKGNLRMSQAIETVITLADLQRNHKDVNITGDVRFGKVIKRLEDNSVNRVEPMAIISCLKSLKELEVNSDSFCVRNLENSLTWLARSCSIKDLVMSFSFSLARQETETQRTLHREIIQALERRWVEIKEGRLFVTLVHSSQHFSTQFINHLEDRIADLVEEMPPSDLVAILAVLGRRKRRNVPLIRALTFHIAKNRTSLDVKQISDVLFALNSLSFKEQDTLERICSGLEGQIEQTENNSVIRSILISLGQLRFLPNTIIDRICDWYKNRMESGKPLESRDISTLIVTLGNLNYKPDESDKLFEDLLGRLSKSEIISGSSRGSHVWLDIVWSLVVLEKAQEEHISSVLEQDFVTELLATPDQKRVGAKILNINAAAKLLHKDYKGPVLEVADDPILRDLSIPVSISRIKFKKFALESLSTLFPPPRFILTDVNTGQGWTADAEVICDKQAKPLQVEEYSTRFVRAACKKELPSGAHRIAVITNSFQDCLLSGGITGLTSLNMRLSRASGYLPLLIEYKDISASMKTVTRIQKLDTMVKLLIGVKK